MGKRRKEPPFPEMPKGGTPLSQWAAGNNAQLLAKRGEVLNIVTMLIKANDQRKSKRWRLKRWLQRLWHRTKYDLHELGLWANLGTRFGRPKASVVDPELLLKPHEEAPLEEPAAPPASKETLA